MRPLVRLAPTSNTSATYCWKVYEAVAIMSYFVRGRILARCPRHTSENRNNVFTVAGWLSLFKMNAILSKIYFIFYFYSARNAFLLNQIKCTSEDYFVLSKSIGLPWRKYSVYGLVYIIHKNWGCRSYGRQKSQDSCEINLKVYARRHIVKWESLRDANTSDRIVAFRCEFDNGKWCESIEISHTAIHSAVDTAIHMRVTYANIMRTTAEAWTAAEFDRTWRNIFTEFTGWSIHRWSNPAGLFLPSLSFT